MIVRKKYQNRFKEYLRQCRDCNENFYTSQKRGKYCPTCKKIRTDKRFENSLKSRGIVIAKIQINISKKKLQ